MIEEVRRSPVRGQVRRPSLVISVVVLAAVLVACERPVEGGPPDMADVESHLNLAIGFIPEGCDPVGLDGDGRGRMMGAGFDCTGGATLRIERLDSALDDDELPTIPTETSEGRVEWRAQEGGDAIRVVSDDLDTDVLLLVAESIDVRD
jgi:hypothetical protein